MLAAIDFHNELFLAAYKIRYVSSDRSFASSSVLRKTVPLTRRAINRTPPSPRKRGEG
jgi:hypothetical protein